MPATRFRRRHAQRGGAGGSARRAAAVHRSTPWKMGRTWLMGYPAVARFIGDFTRRRSRRVTVAEIAGAAARTGSRALDIPDETGVDSGTDAVGGLCRRYLDHLTVERGLAANSLSAYRRDLRRYRMF